MIAIAIDGPAGAGKSTIAKQVAKELGFIYVDTGALYRAIGLYMVNKHCLESEEQIVNSLPELEIHLRFQDGTQHVFLNGRDVSEEIRTNSISYAASEVSKIPQVRTFLLELQRNYARTQNVVMDGRDIGTVVLPDAPIKIYLTASAEVRAHRRFLEYQEQGKAESFESILEAVKERDQKDMIRAVSPLRPAKDAWQIDTSRLTLAQSIQTILDYIKGRLPCCTK